MKRAVRGFIGVGSVLAIACALVGCEKTEIEDPPDTHIDVTQTQCDYDQMCEGTVETANCQVARCVQGTCQAVPAHLWSECSLDGLGDCERGGCNSAGECVAISAEDGTACRNDEWNLCTGYSCESGVCSSKALLECDDTNACTDDTCDASAGGCVHTNNTGACDDGNPCTGGDTCNDGVCVGPENLCQCEQDGDCEAYDDGDKCNGIMVCDVPNKLCKPLEGSEVICDTSEDPECRTTTCNPATGQCQMSNNPDYEQCDDGDPCTGCAPGDADCAQFDYCAAGACTAGLGDACSCEVDQDCLALDDGDVCNGGWTCDAGQCVEDLSTAVDCSGQEAPVCQVIACNAQNGACEPVDDVDGTTCDDENPCTQGDQCMAGACTAGETNVCACDGETDCSIFDDGDVCNGTWTCQDGFCAHDASTVKGDTDADGVCDDVDLCTGDNATGDVDSDGVCAELDACEEDPLKQEAGVCGCGVADTDEDSDGTPDCNDGCPDSSIKTEPGGCGCYVVDTDTDSDGTPDCNDKCPDDPDKIAIGLCGCGAPDTDDDDDGTPNCLDSCPDDPLKLYSGVCGCGNPDFDTDTDGTMDCEDDCPLDKFKTADGICGCGVADTDSDDDGTADCNDQCPSDKDKVAPGECGCGVVETPGC